MMVELQDVEVVGPAMTSAPAKDGGLKLETSPLATNFTRNLSPSPTTLGASTLKLFCAHRQDALSTRLTINDNLNNPFFIYANANLPILVFLLFLCCSGLCFLHLFMILLFYFFVIFDVIRGGELKVHKVHQVYQVFNFLFSVFSFQFVKFVKFIGYRV